MEQWWPVYLLRFCGICASFYVSMAHSEVAVLLKVYYNIYQVYTMVSRSIVGVSIIQVLVNVRNKGNWKGWKIRGDNHESSRNSGAGENKSRDVSWGKTRQQHPTHTTSQKKILPWKSRDCEFQNSMLHSNMNHVGSRELNRPKGSNVGKLLWPKAVTGDLDNRQRCVKKQVQEG